MYIFNLEIYIFRLKIKNFSPKVKFFIGKFWTIFVEVLLFSSDTAIEKWIYLACIQKHAEEMGYVIGQLGYNITTIGHKI